MGQNVSVDRLAHAAKEINGLLELDDDNKILDNVKKYSAPKVKEVKEEILEAAEELSKADEVSEITAKVLTDLGSKAKFSVKKEKKKAAPKAKGKAKKETPKAKGKAKKETTPKAKSDGFREGSGSDIVLQAIISSKAKGTTKEQLLKTLKGKVDTSNLKGKIDIVVKLSMERGYITQMVNGNYKKG